VVEQAENNGRNTICAPSMGIKDNNIGRDPMLAVCYFLAGVRHDGQLKLRSGLWEGVQAGMIKLLMVTRLV